MHAIPEEEMDTIETNEELLEGTAPIEAIDPTAEFVQPKAANAPVFASLHVPGEFIMQVNQDAGIVNPHIELPKNGDDFQDPEIVQNKAKELVRYINKASEQYKFDRSEVIWIGYSNGATAIAAILLYYPTVIQKAVLLRPDSIVIPKPLPVFADVFTLLSTGRQDETVPLETTEKLVRTFQHCGAIVELSQHDAGHEITAADALAVQKWMLRQHK